MENDMSEQLIKQELIQSQPRWNGRAHFNPLAQFVMRGFKRWQRRKAIADLERLSDRVLRDIGISRNDIPRVVDGMLPEPETPQRSRPARR